MAPDLEDTDEGLGEVVERAAPHLHVLEVKLAPKELHAQQRKDDDEEEEKEQQRGNGADRVEQGGHQVAQGCPVPGERRDGSVQEGKGWEGCGQERVAETCCCLHRAPAGRMGKGDEHTVGGCQKEKPGVLAHSTPVYNTPEPRVREGSQEISIKPCSVLLVTPRSCPGDRNPQPGLVPPPRSHQPCSCCSPPQGQGQ